PGVSSNRGALSDAPFRCSLGACNLCCCSWGHRPIGVINCCNREANHGEYPSAENKYVVQTAHYFSICSGRRGKFAQRCCWPISRLGSEDRSHSGKAPMAAGLQAAAINGGA